ncbi:MAG: peptidoglycan editing factor PgeF [Acidocella sp.]|nr:peptidoglycan editing factor PgeF [Acidocella sp.]
MKFFTASLPARHGFFTRNGGVSAAPYNSLNCSFSGGDSPDLVSQNRAIVAGTFGLPPDRLLGLRQIHTADVVVVTVPWAAGKGPDADAMVSTIPGLGLGVITADCAPVLVCDREGTIIGAAHAGWRGALAGVLEATVSTMREMGAKDLVAAIGPCIHQASYEVSDDLRDPVLERDRRDADLFTLGRPGHWQFDLPGYCARRLRATGVVTQILAHDTYADGQNFFSHRRRVHAREAAIGHQISVICL